MASFDFHKYQGTGNDFVLLDRRDPKSVLPTQDEIRGLCDRHFGVGGDGVILLLPDQEVDMEMRFFNPDASKSFCGNGSRCAVKAFFELGQEEEPRRIRFRAIDGIHDGYCWPDGMVEVSIGDVKGVEDRNDHVFVDTGSPHVILPTEDPDAVDLSAEAERFKKDPLYMEAGTNVNLVHSLGEGKVRMRTHERGVEAETLSCGSGVTAAALWAASLDGGSEEQEVSTPGGDLMVRFKKDGDAFHDIRLIGPAERVFFGRTL